METNTTKRAPLRIVDLERVAKELDALVAKSRVATRREALEVLVPQIERLRGVGYTWRQIATHLTEVGLEMSADILGVYVGKLKREQAERQETVQEIRDEEARPSEEAHEERWPR